MSYTRTAIATATIVISLTAVGSGIRPAAATVGPAGSPPAQGRVSSHSPAQRAQAGGEHLASIVAWAIEGTHPTRIGYFERDHLAAAYKIVTDELAPILVPVAGADNGVTVVGGTNSQQESASWAIGKFEDAGLTIPTIEIHFHQGSESCNGHRGIFSSGLQRIDVCVEKPAVILHEIAHAWNHAHLSDARRSEYVSVGGFGSWDDRETPWYDRGSEDAADTIAWALLDDPITGFTADGPIARTNAAYRLLTGEDAPRVLVEERP